MKDKEESPNLKPKKMKNKQESSNTRERSRLKRGTIDIYAVQCARCFKWRTIDNQDEYEDIRSKFNERPFYCHEKPGGISCDTPADLEYNASRIWVLDKPNIPKTPSGFRRELILRRDFSRVDAFYVTPTGKRVRSRAEAAAFLQEHPECKGASPKDFNFAVPRVVEDTVPPEFAMNDLKVAEDS